MIKYAVIYENGWYWNGTTLTQYEYLFDSKPIIDYNMIAVVTEEWTPIRHQIGITVPLRYYGFSIVEKIK